MLQEWCTAFNWVGRAALDDAELDYARKQEMQRQVEEQAREDSRLLHSVGSGALATAAVLLSDLLDPSTGLPKRPAQPRDIQPLARAGIECLAAAGGQMPASGEGGSGLDVVLGAAPEDVRTAILRGLRALLDWQESTATRRR